MSDFRGKRAKLNVYDDAMDDLTPIDCQNIVYLKRDDVIPKDLADKLMEFGKSFIVDLSTYEKINEKLPEGCISGTLHPIDVED